MVKNNIDEIMKFLDDNDNITKDKAIKKLGEKFNIKTSTATEYYYRWKQLYTGNKDCIPEKIKKK